MADDTEVHPINITSIPETPYELGRMIAKLRFDAQHEILRGFKFETDIMANEDHQRRRFQLAVLGDKIARLSDLILRAFKLSRGHMREELKKLPALLE